MRFTLRELLLVTLAVGLALGWQLDRSYVARQRERARRHAEALRIELDRAEQNEQVYLGKLVGDAELDSELVDVEWELADRMIP